VTISRRLVGAVLFISIARAGHGAS